MRNEMKREGREGEARFGLSEKELFRLLRHSHIFASVVREFLEVKLLDEVCTVSLTPAQFHLLKLTVCCGTPKVGEVARFLGVSAPSASKNIDKLERLGLVERVPSEHDRRATTLRSTEKGDLLVARYEELQEIRLGPVFDALTREELLTLTGSMERFSLAMIESQRPTDSICLRCSAYYDEDCKVGPLRGGCPYRKVRHNREIRTFV